MDRSELSYQLFYDNEVRTNRLASIALGVLGVLQFTIVVLAAVGIFDLGSELCSYGFAISAVLGCSLYPVAKAFAFRKRWIKKMILTSVVLSSSISFFLYPLNADFLGYGPVLICAMYYDRKMIRRTALICCILYGLMLLANTVLEQVSDTLREFHAYQEIGIFHYPLQVITYHFIPHVVSVQVVRFICDGIARRGVEYVEKQVRNTETIYAMKNELEAASEMQISTLPENRYTTDDGNIKISAFMRPAKMVAGDFYDYFRKGDNLVFLVADVSDKGLPAALFMMKAKNAIRAAFQAVPDFREAVKTVNTLLCNDNKENMFVTLWIAEVNIRTGIGLYVNCGHLPPILQRGETVQRIKNEPDMILGVFEEYEVNPHVLRLQGEDTVVIFTDGLTDAVNVEGQFFGDERLTDAVRKISPFDPDGNERLIREVDGFVGKMEQFDDMTCMCVHIEKTDAPVEKIYRAMTGNGAAEEIIDQINSLLETVSCPPDIQRNVDVVIDEVCDNISEYAYDGESGSFSVSVKVGRNYIELCFTDSGMEFDPLAKETGAITDEIRIGGLGIYLYKSIMDCAEYSRVDNENRLTLTKIWSE